MINKVANPLPQNNPITKKKGYVQYFENISLIVITKKIQKNTRSDIKIQNIQVFNIAI